MGDVYRNAYLMVAAANATDDAEGFLKLRPNLQCALKVVAPTGRIARMYIQPWKNRHDRDTKPNRLNTRGWTLQEAYLSRRRLTFLDNKITRECQSASWSETGRDGIHRDFGGKYKCQTSVTELLLRKTSHHQNIYRPWYYMIERFSLRQFSVLTDRLPALSGLATMVAAYKDGKYCAGL